MTKIVSGLADQPVKFIEVPMKATVLVPEGVGSTSIMVVEHFNRVRVFLFEGPDLKESETTEGEEFEDVVQKVKNDLKKAVRVGA